MFLQKIRIGLSSRIFLKIQHTSFLINQGQKYLHLISPGNPQNILKNPKHKYLKILSAEKPPESLSSHKLSEHP